MNDADTLRGALTELRAERAQCETPERPGLAEQLERVRRWQADHVAARHRDHAARHDGAALLRFLSRSFYLEADWSELTDDPDRTVARVGRIMSDLRPLIVAARLQASADRLDRALAAALLDGRHPVTITPIGYVRAFRRVGEAAERERQLAWVGELIERLAGFADNRAAWWAFKAARAPARGFGMGQTHVLLAEGFAALRATRDPAEATREALDAQRVLVRRLFGAATAGAAPPSY